MQANGAQSIDNFLTSIAAAQVEHELSSGNNLRFMMSGTMSSAAISDTDVLCQAIDCLLIYRTGPKCVGRIMQVKVEAGAISTKVSAMPTSTDMIPKKKKKRKLVDVAEASSSSATPKKSAKKLDKIAKADAEAKAAKKAARKAAKKALKAKGRPDA